jgi:hypothetical protein
MPENHEKYGLITFQWPRIPQLEKERKMQLNLLNQQDNEVHYMDI